MPIALTIHSSQALQVPFTKLIYSSPPIATRVSGDPESDNNGLFYFHSDHLGSATFLTYGNGHASEGLKKANSTKFFTPFGEYRIDPPDPEDDITDRGFTGHKHNDDIELIYMNARYYVPTIGRFASADTIVPNAADPQSFNRFSYTRNNPINFTDPTGHRECEFDDNCGPPVPYQPPRRVPSPPEPEFSSPLPPLVKFEDFDANDDYQAQLMAAIEEAAYLVGEALADVLNSQFSWNLTPAEAFLLVYGDTVTFTWKGTKAQNAAFVNGPNDIWVYDTRGSGYPGAVGSKTHWAIHELGHAFSQALGGVPEGDTRIFLGNYRTVGRPRGGASDNDDNLYRYAGDLTHPWIWQHNLSGSASEQFADMFLGWVYGQWEPGGYEGTGLTYAGYSMSSYMNNNMSGWLNLVVYK